jgi:hypothetical protein
VRAIKRLLQSNHLETNFIIRDKSEFTWSFGYLLAQRNSKTVDLRKQYLDNILQSDYVLCVRGLGNYSIRLYETLCLGRIPVIIDTDLVLPFHQILDWKSFAIIVHEKEIRYLPEIVAEFHRNLKPEQFLELQVRCRRVWEEWLSPHGFFSKFYLHFENDTNPYK